MEESIILTKVVYYDQNYIGSWISDDESKIICDYFKEKGFKILNADELLVWMEFIQQTPHCNESTLIFSQDIIPTTICADVNQRQPIYRYLRRGGKIIWIGDIPFFYRGLSGRDLRTLPIPGELGLRNLLTINMVDEDYVDEVKITVEGKRLGLKSGIMGSRPVYKSYGLVPLATSFNRQNIEVANMWIKMGFIRLFDINHEDDVLFDINDHLDEIHQIAEYPLDMLIKDAQGKRDIFIVHGHDKKSRRELSELLTNHNLRPRFLHEYSIGCETLVDLLERAQECVYVIIILTPDDYAMDSAKYVELTKKASDICAKDCINALQPRGRQNVIFEFGFFRGLFGKNRVCVLLKDHPSNTWDIPSDISGVYYSKYKDSIYEKESEIINRLKRAGIL